MATEVGLRTFAPRGRGLSLARKVFEPLLERAYAYSWPARVWSLLPGACRVRLVQHVLPVSRPGRPRLRLAFASDIHIGPTTPPATLDNGFALLERAAPDVLVLGGDYVYLEATRERVAELAARVAAVPAKTKVAVLGNHDLWTHHHRIEDALRDAGVTILVNDAVRLPPPHDDVAIVGLDEPSTGEPDGARAVAAAGDAAVRLAVSHSPDGFPYLAGAGVSLLMCGHTHGGQVALPGHRPIIVHSRHGRQWPHGLRDSGAGFPVFVSRGMGTVGLPFRTYAPADVALFTIG